MPEEPVTVAIIDLRGANRPAGVKSGPYAVICGLPVVVRSVLVARRKGFERIVALVEHSDDAHALLAHPRSGPIEVVIGTVESIDLRSEDRVLTWPAALSFGRHLPSAALQAAPATGVARIGTDGLLLSHGLPTETVTETRASDQPAVRVTSPEARREAEALLLRSLRKDADGIVAQFDRHISLALSRPLMATNISPNVITILGAVIGIASGVAAAHGGYAWMLAGALGFQWNSISDGIDGEIARAKLLESRLGQWLDTWADDSTNLVFCTGAAIGCYRTFGGEHFLWLSGLIAIGITLSALLQYHYVHFVLGSGDLNEFRMPWERGRAHGERDTQAPSLVARGLMALKPLVRRDAFVAMTTVCALLNWWPGMVYAYSIGATVTWTAILFYKLFPPTP